MTGIRRQTGRDVPGSLLRIFGLQFGMIFCTWNASVSNKAHRNPTLKPENPGPFTHWSRHPMRSEGIRMSTGIGKLDQIIEGLNIGDNVVWYDDAGSLAMVFCQNFIEASRVRGYPLIYVSFDRSPRNLLEKLGTLSDYPELTVLDCFTCGKGASSDVFLRFYEEAENRRSCNVIRVENPKSVQEVMDAFYGVHEKMDGEVHFVFESLTGMQELWGGEEHLIDFYVHSCPRLYELRTIAYWIIEKQAHSQKLRAKINHVAQVAIELSVKRGRTALTLLKAEGRDPKNLNRPRCYWNRDLQISFEDRPHHQGRFELGGRLKELRTGQGISQTDLARRIGVTPSTISQVENNLIYPSLPALFKMAEVLSVSVGAFFRESGTEQRRTVFPAEGAVAVSFPDLPGESVAGKLLTAPDLETKAEPYLIEIQPKSTLASHFFVHKGEEIGYLLSGRLQMKLKNRVDRLRAGDLIYLTAETPSQWKNPGPSAARLLWLKIK